MSALPFFEIFQQAPRFKAPAFAVSLKSKICVTGYSEDHKKAGKLYRFDFLGSQLG